MMTNLHVNKIGPFWRRAFTLVEMMISVAIFSLMFILLINFFREGISNTESASVKGDNLRDSRLLILHFEQDAREAAELLDYEETDDHTSIQLRRVKVDLNDDSKRQDEYIIYTLYKQVGQRPMSFCRKSTTAKPAPGELATEAIIKGVTKSSGKVGIIASAVDTSNTIVNTEIAAYNMHLDSSFLNNPFLMVSDKEKERARARYMGKYNGLLVGFDKKERIVALEITFITNDQQNIVNIYRSLIYLRKAYYDKLTDENF